MPPHYCLTFVLSVFADWGLEQSEYSSWVFRVKLTFVGAFSRCDELRPGLGGNGMKEATKRAASEALAQTLAVTAMLVIASFIFYWR
jgi:hypothetical protein